MYQWSGQFKLFLPIEFKNDSICESKIESPVRTPLWQLGPPSPRQQINQKKLKVYCYGCEDEIMLQQIT